MASVACCTSLFLSAIVQRRIPGHSVGCLTVLRWNTKLHVLPGQREGGGAWMGSHKYKRKKKKGKGREGKKKKKEKNTLQIRMQQNILWSLCSPSSCSPKLLGPQWPKYMRTCRHDFILISAGHNPESR